MVNTMNPYDLSQVAKADRVSRADRIAALLARRLRRLEKRLEVLERAGAEDETEQGSVGGAANAAG